MGHELKDLLDVMESESAAGRPAPDLHDRLRRRIRRGRRIRLGAGAAVVALAAAAAVPFVWNPDEPADKPDGRPVLTGVENEAFPSSPPKYGMEPVREVRYSAIGGKAQIEFTPPEPTTLMEFRCSSPVTVYTVSDKQGLRSGTCDEGAPLEMFPTADESLPVTHEAVVVPRNVEFGTEADLERYVDSHTPAPGRWSVRIYSGTCFNPACLMRVPWTRGNLSAEGKERLLRETGEADGRPRTISFVAPGDTALIRLTCRDGAAFAVTRIEGRRPDGFKCGTDKSPTVAWGKVTVPGERVELDITVLPAEARRLTSVDEAAIAELMEDVEPRGTWTLEVFAN